MTDDNIPRWKSAKRNCAWCSTAYRPASRCSIAIAAIATPISNISVSPAARARRSSAAPSPRSSAPRPLRERCRSASARLAGETVEWSGWLRYDEGARPRFVQRFYIPYRGPDDEIDGYFVLARDLTDLKLSDARAAAIIASSLDCVVVVDEKGAIVEFNPAAEATFGHTREQFAMGRPMAELIIPPGASREPSRRACNVTSKPAGEVPRPPHRNRSNAGERRDISGRTRHHRNSPG